MSETKHYTGKLVPLNRKGGETLEEQCKRCMNGRPLPNYYDSYEEWITDVKSGAVLSHGGILYSVIRDMIDDDRDIFKARAIGEEIHFDVKYYNGGCNFEEAINIAIKGMK